MQGLREFFFGDWKMKILAFLIALAIFLIVRSDKDTEGSITVRVTYVNQPKTMVLMNELIFSVKVLIRGPWTRVKKINKSTLEKSLNIDLAKVTGGRFELDSTMFKLPRGIRVTSISPSHLPIRMESILTRTVPITLGKIKTDRFHHVADIKLVPDKITITGPKSDVLSVLSVPLPSMTIPNERVTEKRIKLPDLPPRLVIKPAVSEVLVKIILEKVKETKVFEKLPILVDGDASLFRLSPTVVKALVEGDKKALYELAPSQIQLYITMPLTPVADRFTLPVRIKPMGKGLTIRMVPARISVSRIHVETTDDKKAKKAK
ncbi:hypothetical protein KKF84_14505 [Myxococcota bacterium]|nr:hypothetical protein [Myxococcota bacterium]